MTPDTRAILLENLAAGFPPRRALSHACGKKLPMVAWRELVEMRRVGGDGWDAEVAEACERSERRAKENDGAKQGDEAGARRADADPAGHDAEGDEGSAGPVQAAGILDAGGCGGGDPVGHLGPSRGGRSPGEEETEGGGKTETGGPVGHLHAMARPEDGDGHVASGTGAAGLHESLVAPPLHDFWSGAAADEAAPESGECEPPAPRYSKRASEATDDGAPDWKALRAEATERAPGPFGWVLLQEDRLHRSGAGFPALSPFTLRTIDSFFLSGKRWLLWLAGRGFGKSTLTSRLATAIGFGVERRAAPGPAWVCPIVSVLPVDADRRLEDIQQLLLHAYHQEVKIATGKSMVSARDSGANSIAWVSSASTIGNVSGPSSFAALVDEEEKILHGRAGAIVGSLAYTFRSRPHVYGFRVSSAMGVDGTLARACKKSEEPNPPLTNHVVTLGDFLEDAVTGLLAVASWEDSVKKQPDVAIAIRAHAYALTRDSWQIPTWLGNPSTGRPTEDAPWGPGQAAIATRIEAEAVDEQTLEGFAPWRYWLRECASAPTGGEAVNEWDGDGAECGELSRYADVHGGEDRGYG